MSETRIVTTHNGPYKVSGGVEVVDETGKAISDVGTSIYLCRCGASLNKPFCDGTHAKIGFDGTLASAR